MANAPADAAMPRLLSLTVHELRTPISVVRGYLRMVLKDPAGSLDDRYRRMLEESEKSCDRLTAIVAEISDLSALEAGAAAFKRAPVDVAGLLAEAIAALPPLHDRDVEVRLASTGAAMIEGDAARLKTAFTSVLYALRREVVSNDRLVVRVDRDAYRDKPGIWIRIAEEQAIDALGAAGPDTLAAFDEWRGGCGLILPIARRIIEGHDGALWSLQSGPKAAAVMVIPAET